MTEPHHCIAGSEHTLEDHDQTAPLLVPVEAIWACIDAKHDVGTRHHDGWLDQATCHDCGHRYDRHWSPTASRPVVADARVSGPTFDELLRDPNEQFDRRSELLGPVMRSIDEYANAPSGTVSVPPRPVVVSGPVSPVDLDLAAIEARAAAATQGPWRLSEPQGNWIWPHIANTYGSRREDAEFIAAARSDVPALVAEVKRLREDNAALAELDRSLAARDRQAELELEALQQRLRDLPSPTEVEGLCHWVRDYRARGGVASAAEVDAHRRFHFGDQEGQLGICPYWVVAAVMRGQGDPRDRALDGAS